MQKKKNQPLVKVIILLICGGLVFSTVAAALISIFDQPAAEDPAEIYRKQLAQTQTLIVQTEASLADEPENKALLRQLGGACYTAGQLYAALQDTEKSRASFAQALEPYGKFLQLEPENVTVRVERAGAAYAAENNTLAQAEFIRAIEIDPNYAQAYFSYGVFLYFALRQPEEALEQWEKVVELNPAGEEELVETTRTWIAAVQKELAAATAEETD